MKNGYSILTRRIQGMDVNVWFTLFFVIIISGGLLIYKILSIDVFKAVDISVVDESGSSKNKFYTNEGLTFTTKVKGKIVWDFGDTFQANGNHVVHNFSEEGKKVIIIYVNGKVGRKDTLYINKIADNTQAQVETNPIIGPDAAIVGHRATYFYHGTRKVNSFEWSIVNTPVYQSQHSNKAAYNFLSEGSVTVQLQLDHDPAKTYTKNVVVSPARGEPKVAASYRPPTGGGQSTQPKTENPVVAPVVTPAVQKTEPVAETKKFASDADFKRMLEDVIAGRRTAQDFAPYLCSGVNTKVIAKGKDETIASICATLSRGKYKIESVQSTRDFQQCVSVMRVDYKKKGILGL